MNSKIISKVYRKNYFRFYEIYRKKEDVFNLLLELKLTHFDLGVRLFKFEMNSDKMKIVPQ